MLVNLFDLGAFVFGFQYCAYGRFAAAAHAGEFDGFQWLALYSERFPTGRGRCESREIVL